MRRTCPVSLSVFAILFALCFVENSLAQQNRSSISGFVFGSDRRPVSQVIVELRSEFSTIGRVRTDGSGRYFFSSLAHGRYTIRVLPMGTPYLEQSEDVEISGIGARGQSLTDNVQKDVYLKPRRAPDSVPFQAEVVYAQAVPPEAESHYKRAIADLNSQRVQTGIASLEKAVEVFPDYFAALQRLGVIRIGQERFADAAVIFDHALKINARSFDCWYGLAFANYTIRRFDAAVEAAKKAVFQKPDSTEANLLLGMSLRIIKDFPGAETALRSAAKLSDGANPDVHWNLALLYGKDMNKFAEAAKELEAYLKAAPEAPNKEEIKKLIKQFKDKARSAA